jgi:hypothetical protein
MIARGEDDHEADDQTSSSQKAVAKPSASPHNIPHAHNKVRISKEEAT